jgi:ketosteroid isomerase-like protein
MNKHPVEELIERADLAIVEERFDDVIEMYSDDAVLVVKPGTNAVGKIQIREALEAIAKYFKNTLKVKQAGMKILETGDVALVLARTLVSAHSVPEMERKATYVFKYHDGVGWLCVIDNSYGHELLNEEIY